jgi:hypothetical protein
MGKYIMKKTALMIGITAALAISSSTVFAANANTTPKGSLLIYPLIDVREGATTWVRIVNDGLAAVTVKCYYMDVNKQRNDFEFVLTAFQPFVFDAETGASPIFGQAPQGANSFPPGADYGELVCFAVSPNGTALANFNNLAGTALVVRNGQASEYNAWAFKANTATPGAGDLVLNGTAYDSCPAYLFGQFSPLNSPTPVGLAGNTVIDISSCKQDLRQDYNTNVTKLQFDVWRYDETRYTGAYNCSNSFYESALESNAVVPPFNRAMVMPGNFSNRLLKGPAYYRVQGVASTQCNYTGFASAPTGLVGVQTTYLPGSTVTTELGASNTPGPAGFVKWDASGGLTGKK